MSTPTFTREEIVHATQPWVTELLDALAAEGIAPNLVAGTITMLASDATPTFDLVETSDNTYRLDLGLPRGIDGVIGKDGAPGAPGAPGRDGTNGINGTNGKDGEPGSTGPQGDIGPAGPSGLTPRGNYDATIAYVPRDLVTYGGSGYYALNPPPNQGTPPTNDPNGDDTAVNTGWAFLVMEGARGQQGIQGVPGTAATVAINSVTTTAPGTAATVVNNGTATNALLDITLPRGDKGEKGDKGDAGAPGTAGTNGTNGTNGVDGTNGTNGVDGAAAMTASISSTSNSISNNVSKTFFTAAKLTGVAVGARMIVTSRANLANFMAGVVTVINNTGANPYVTLQIDTIGGSGTFTDWSLYMPGPKGDKGDTGAPGTNGTAGAAGNPGSTGAPGVGVDTASIDANNHLILRYTDGTVHDAGLVGASASGRGITNAVIDASGNLILSYSDDTSSNVGRVVGANGTNGADGVGYTSAAITGGHLILTRSTGGTLDVGQVVGPKGDKGDPGETGASGINYRGIWASNVSYLQGDAVNFGGAAYWARVNNTNVQPSVDGAGNPVITDTWAVLSLRGAKGEPGTAGAAGTSPTITLAPTQQGATGSSPAVTNLGTTTAAQFQFTFPPPAVVVRKTFTVTVNNMAPNADTSLSLALSPSYVLLAIKTSVAARLRVYSTGAAATRDISRPVTTYPAGNAEMVMEYVTTTANQTYAISPAVMGASIADPPVATHAAILTNLSQNPANVTLTLTYATLEN